MSEAVLQAIDGGGSSIEVTGLPWQRTGESQRIATGSLTGRVLCKRHNEALSYLDEAAAELVHALEHIHCTFDDGKDDEHAIDGGKFERWMLKCLCGLLASKNAVNHRGLVPDWRPARHWIAILFEGAQFLAGQGLYVAKVGEEVCRQLLRMQPLWGPDEQTCAGVVVWFFDVQYILVMNESAKDAAECLLEDAAYRPAEIVYKDPSCTKRLSLRENELSRGGGFSINRVPRPAWPSLGG